VFPSTGGESFGIVLIEAMAAGARVVLGGNNPGYKSILGPQPYLLFNPKDLRSFADHLSLFINDQQLRDRMFTWQIDTVGQYDIEVIGPKLLGSYEQALRTRTP
jgi:phosphatidylinositol alpha-mannosyltransferase